MSPHRSQRKARKLDRPKVLELAQQGMSTADISQHQRVAPSTVFRFLQQTEPERQALEHFKKNRADVLARIQAKSLDVQERIIDSLKDPVIDALTPSQKTGMLTALNVVHGTTFDKERLHSALSTHNVSQLTQILNLAVDEAYKPKSPSPVKPPIPQSGACQPLETLK